MRKRLFLFALIVLMLTHSPLQGAEVFGLVGNPRVSVDGFGLFGDMALSRALDILEPQEGKGEQFDSIYVEDALWILSGELKRRGYLYPAIEAKIMHDKEILWEGTWKAGEVTPALSRRISGDAVHLQVSPGVLFYFEGIRIDGLPDEVQAKPASFFYTTDRLVVTNEARFYSGSRLASGVDSIELRLRDLGYRDVRAQGKAINIDEETGAVDIEVQVDPGPLYYTKTLILEAPDGEGDVQDERSEPESQRLTPDFLQQQAQSLRNRYYALGYPQVRVTQDVQTLAIADGIAQAAVTLQADPGPQVRISSVSFKDTGKTSPALLERQAALQEGALLNRTKVEEGRDRLTRLGIFRSIRIDYDEADESQWDVSYDTVLKKQTIVNLILGVGSFDIVRGGFEVLQNNLWGLAHQSRLSAIQSFKATYLDYTYTIPQIFGEDLDFFLSANYLRREEITFDREEYGGSAGLQHYFADINTAASIQYNYGQVEAKNAEFAVPPGPDQAFVSSITLKASRNELDNPVFPTDGWQVFGTSEFAFSQLGGEVEFQRVELGGAWHKPITDSGLVFHAGYKTGVVTSLGPSSENIPVPKRFFLGGENTVRGYRRDQAAPVNAQGQQIGAVSYMLWQVELEQRLTELFSVVAFVDTVGNAASIEDYPFNEVLMSVGGGISIRTVVGPLRFEYGHNVKKRPDDPDGTFQVALGFPF